MDAGDALFADESVPEPRARLRAHFILESMGKLGYAAMAVGERDLNLGAGELAQLAKKSKVELLAANLTDEKGNKVFGSRLVKTAGGVRVGIFGVSGGPSFERHGYRVLPAAKVAQEQIDALRAEGAALVVGLMHLPYAEALQVANGARGLDFVIQAHDRRTEGTQSVGKAVLTGAGERGRSLGRAKFELRGGGPLIELAPAKARAELADLEKRIADLKQQQKSNPAAKEKVEPLLQGFIKRREALAEQADRKPGPGLRTVASELIVLGTSVHEDPEWSKVEREAP